MKTHEELCAMTMQRLKEYAKEIGCILGYDAARKDTAISAIESQQWHLMRTVTRDSRTRPPTDGTD